MAGMIGFEHKCDCQKVDFQKFKNSLLDSPYSHAQVSIIWDFYVTCSIAGESGQALPLEKYDWNDNQLKKLEDRLMEVAGISSMCSVRAKTIKATLKECDLFNSQICIEHPRIVLMQKYQISVDENEKLTYGGGGNSENRIRCLFRHIRNAFAHGNTYFFDNGNVLLEDKDKSTITARILLKQQTLLDWISVVDYDQKYYKLVDVCKSCPQAVNSDAEADG